MPVAHGPPRKAPHGFNDVSREAHQRSGKHDGEQLGPLAGRLADVDEVDIESSKQCPDPVRYPPCKRAIVFFFTVIVACPGRGSPILKPAHPKHIKK